jgi:DNA-directed RNA polymerase specialized sigma24 family protein
MNADASNCNSAKEMDPLADVVVAGQQADRDAQKQLHDACRQSVFSLAVRMVGWQDAADVTQMVFLQAVRSLSKFNRESKFETWLYRLAVNVIAPRSSNIEHVTAELNDAAGAACNSRIDCPYPTSNRPN